MLVLFTVFPCLIATLVLSTTNHDDITGIHAAFYCSPDVYRTFPHPCMRVETCHYGATQDQFRRKKKICKPYPLSEISGAKCA